MFDGHIGKVVMCIQQKPFLELQSFVLFYLRLTTLGLQHDVFQLSPLLYNINIRNPHFLN
jgi:hypothetical protein